MVFIILAGLFILLVWYYLENARDYLLLLFALWSVMVVAVGLQYVAKRLTEKYAPAEPASEDTDVSA